MIRSVKIIVGGEGGQPACGAGWPAVPGIVEAFQPHFQRLKPFLDQVAVLIVEVTAQIAPRQGGQVAHAVNQKLGRREVVSVLKSLEECGGGGAPAPPREFHAKKQL